VTLTAVAIGCFIGLPLGAALGRSRAWLLSHADEPILDCDATDRYEAFVTRRARAEPVAYILGEKEFWSLTLEVTPAVLIPRPETELAVELALQRLPLDAPCRILDLATGSGAIALAIAQERPQARVVATDISAAALAVATRNRDRLRLANVTLRHGNWFEPVVGERFDLIVSNPPYIAADDPRVEPAVRRFEPPGALFTADDGLAALRVIAAAAGTHLVHGGALVVDTGDTQGPAMRELLQSAGFTDATTQRDLAGRDRCTTGRWPNAAGA